MLLVFADSSHFRIHFSCKMVEGSLTLFVVLMVPFTALLQECSATDIAKEPYIFPEIFGELNAEVWNGTWIKGDAFYYETRSENGISMVIYNVTSRRKSILIEYAYPEALWIEQIIPSPDLQYILIKYNKSIDVMETVTTAQYKILKLDNKGRCGALLTTVLSSLPTSSTSAPPAIPLGDSPLWFGDYYEVAYCNAAGEFNQGQSPSSKPRRLTFDGAEGRISNGISQGNGYPGYPTKDKISVKFSPDGKHLAFLKFNSTNVKTYDYSVYGEPGDFKDQYPRIKKIKYSKVGSNIPAISISVVDLTNSASAEKTLNTHSFFIFDIAWPTMENISFVYTNRVQDSAWVVRCDLNDLCRQESVYYETNGWIEPHLPRYSKDDRTVDIQPAPEGNDTYYHLILTDLKNKNSTRLTFGRRRVTGIFHWDEFNNLIYYQSSIEDYPSREHAFRINTITLEDVCITCNFSTPSGPCLRGTIDLNENATHFAKICKGPGPDYVVLNDVMEVSTPIIWIDNSELLLKLNKKLQPIQKDLLVPIADGYNARVRLFFPPDYNETSSQIYPTLVYAYAGPDVDVISDAYDSHFWIKNYWVTNKKYIYVMIEGRGSGGDGRNKMFEIYKRIGTVEIEDQLNVTRYLQQNIPGIDPNNTGIWGWGYGGFTAGMVVARDTEIVEQTDSIPVFALAVLVSPVTNLLYSSSIYIEKYIGLPTKTNLTAYKNADICSRAGQFVPPFLLIHGTADNTINYQHTIMFIKALHRENMAFNLMVYPDDDHEFSNNAIHAFMTIDRFLHKNFKL